MAVQAPYRDQYSLYDLTAQYDTGVGSIVASTTFGKKKLVDTEDTSAMSCLYGLCRGTPIYPSIYRSDIDFSDWTDEVRFSSDFSGPLQLVAGAYYEQDIKDYSGAVLVGHQATGIALCDNYVACADGGFIQPGFGNNPVVYAFNEHFNVNQYAFYGQLDYQILPDLTATVGARYFGAHLSDQQLQQQDVYPDFIFGLVTTPYYRPRLESNESKTTYNFALLWKATSDVSLYARVASGFRIGGINNAAALAAQQGVILPTSYAPDSLWDYEGGAKIFLIDRTLFLDFSAFHIDWNNQQLNALAFGTYNYEINAGKTTTNGVSLSATYQPGGGLTLSGNINYVDAKLATDLPANVVDGGTPGLDGDRVPNVPHWSFAGHAEYDHPLCEQLIGYVGTDFNYRGDSSTAFRPVTPAQAAAGIPDNFAFHIPSYFLLNFRAGVRFDRYDVSVFTQNVTNKVAYAGVLSDLSGTRVYSVPPRTIGVRLSAAF
jgi:outer membrane receptor protein involved in Fe transport